MMAVAKEEQKTRSKKCNMNSREWNNVSSRFGKRLWSFCKTSLWMVQRDLLIIPITFFTAAASWSIFSYSYLFTMTQSFQVNNCQFRLYESVYMKAWILSFIMHRFIFTYSILFWKLHFIAPSLIIENFF